MVKKILSKKGAVKISKINLRSRKIGRVAGEGKRSRGLKRG